jgi:glycosyltransferase involved in cell wall biosynthesis
MTRTPLVSVVVPIHNVAAYLPQCLASVRSQTHGNLEIVCVDDGSTDTSSMIAKDAMAADDRILVRTTENGGLGRARNLGLELALGDYIAFLDADDVLPARERHRVFPRRLRISRYPRALLRGRRSRHRLLVDDV